MSYQDLSYFSKKDSQQNKHLSNDHSEEQEINQRSKSRSINGINLSSNVKLMSPLYKDIFQFKDFSTPIQIAQFSEHKKYGRNQDHIQESSPLMLIQLSDKINKIAQRQNQQSEGQKDSFDQNHQIQQINIIDLMGNKICEFNVGYGKYEQEQLSPIYEDKQNDLPMKRNNLMTPLKVRQHDLRSPLQDITPSMTHKKKQFIMNTKTNKKNRTSNKTANKGLELQKLGLLTPRTMAQSRLNKVKNPNLNNSKLKIERF